MISRQYVISCVINLESRIIAIAIGFIFTFILLCIHNYPQLSINLCLRSYTILSRPYSPWTSVTVFRFIYSPSRSLLLSSHIFRVYFMFIAITSSQSPIHSIVVIDVSQWMKKESFIGNLDIEGYDLIFFSTIRGTIVQEGVRCYLNEGQSINSRGQPLFIEKRNRSGQTALSRQGNITFIITKISSAHNIKLSHYHVLSIVLA